MVKAGTPARPAPGPQVGAPPSLEQVPVDRLNVDPAYQRATDSASSRRTIAGMVKRWDWSLCLPLVVARRDDGSLWIIDGQHRHSGARQRGDIPFLPCVIRSGLDPAGEARAFVDLNTKPVKLNQAEIFHGMLAAGDIHARAVQQLLDETGWRLRRDNNSADYQPGDLQCAPMMAKVVAARGEMPVRFGLSILRAAYPDKPVRLAGTMLSALFDLFEGAVDSALSAASIIAAIAMRDPSEWLNRGIALQDANPSLSRIKGLSRVLMQAALDQAGQPPPPAPAPAPAAPVVNTPPRTVPASQWVPRKSATPGKSPFGTADKGWCDQCDQLRSKASAAACADRFCKLRPFT